MAHINLLPWREELRKQKQQEFLVQVGLAAVFGAALWGLAHMEYANRIDSQNNRNAFLDQEIQKVNKEITKIKDLESTKANLLARMNVIQELQSNRPVSVHLMDELVRTLPDGVYLTTFTQKGTQLTMNGVAQSNARVSAYMRNIDASPWLTSPKLQVIETKTDNRARTATFTLTAAQKAQQVQDDGKETTPGASAKGGKKADTSRHKSGAKGGKA